MISAIDQSQIVIMQWVTTSIFAASAALVAAFGALIAYRQWRTANYKLKLDLFDRRYNVFVATREYLEYSFQKEDMSGEVLKKDRNLMAQSSFLFPEDISTYLQEIRNEASRRHDNRPKDKMSEAQIEDLLDWLGKTDDDLVDRFSPYLDFRDIR